MIISCAYVGRRLLLCFSLFIFFGFSNVARAYAYDPPIPPTTYTVSTIMGFYNYGLTATSAYKTGAIYDDFNFPEYLPGNPDVIYWNCTRKFLLTSYTNPDDAVDLVISNDLGSSINCDINVYRDPDYSAPVAAYTNIALGEHFTFSSYTQGLYVVDIRQHGASMSTAPILEGFIILIPKIKKMWVEATPVCSGSSYASGTFYNFKVRTDPAISSIIDQPTNLGLMHVGGGGVGTTIPPVCDEFIPYSLIFQFVTSDICFNNPPVFNAPSTSGLANFVDVSNPSTVPDAIDYYIDYTQLAPDLSNATTPNCYGNNLFIQVTYTDDIAYTSPYTGGTPLTVSAPIIIETSVSDILPSINPLATPGAGINGPPNATGIPWSSFDIYDYTVTGNEIWTTTNNPISAMNGNGSTVSIIRIQHRLHIPAGASLTIQSGMSIEMGPAAAVIVDNATDALHVGGLLDMENCLITSYRGCGDLAGGDHCTWAGIILNSNLTFPQGYWNSCPNGRLLMNNSTISYAWVGVTTGGAIYDAGGGAIIANNSTFYNNGLDVAIIPYTNMAGSIELNSIEIFSGCNFTYDGNAWFTPAYFFEAEYVKGVNLYNCLFSNNTGLSSSASGIFGTDAGMTIDGCTFSNLATGVFNTAAAATHGLNLSNCIFNNDKLGVSSYGGIGASITNNTFNIPKYTGTIGSFYPGTYVYVVNDQNIGAYFNGTTGYYLSNNTFQTSANPSSGWGYYSYTTGTMQYNTGSDNNLVTNNTFSGVGVAMLSNFKNNSIVSLTGLQYLCNKDSHIGYDISACGDNAMSGGIKPIQFTSTGPAGNKFSIQWNIYDQQQPIGYYYNPSILHENPVNIHGSVSPLTVSAMPNCVFPAPHMPVKVNPKDPVQAYAIATINVNYYMNDSNGITHRDSLYYWAGQMGTAYGDLLITNLLIEDSLIDSANSVYNNILTNYTLDDVEANDFVQGRNLMDILITNRINNRNILSLDSGQVDSLKSIVANTRMWAHARAECWLYIYEGDPLIDTLLYPGDTMPNPPPCPGVLTVTELSTGPAFLSGCNYGVLTVSGCGQCQSPTVNVQGWIVDDNSGNFNLKGCTVQAGITQSHYRLAYDTVWANVPVGSAIVVYNVDTNCYALPDSFTVITGPVIDSTDSIFITGNLYLVPLGGTEGSPYGKPRVERFKFQLDSSICTYVVDTATDSTTDSSYYAVASDWQNTINFDPNGDAFQVRCPRCDRDMGKDPAFYHGFGYGPAAGDSQFNPIPSDSTSLGGAVINNTGGGYRYCFRGSTSSDLSDPSQWQVLPAAAPGTMPPGLGNVNSAYATGIQQSTLDLPCCEKTYRHHDDNRNRNGGGNNGRTSHIGKLGLQSLYSSSVVQNLTVYPIPATMTLNFKYTLQDNITIKLSDVTGRLLDQQSLQNSSIATFNVTNYAPGIYLYQVITNGNTQSGKVLIGK